MSWVCTTCGESFAAVPEGAVQISPGNRRVNSWRFPDGHMHHLRRAVRPAEMHRFHKTKKDGCELCFPPEPSRPPVEQVLLQEVVAVLAELPEPQPEVIAEPEIEESESELTTMGAAFKRLGK